MQIAKITYPDINNGKGCRVTLWLQGCPHHCDGCHNPETWPLKGGRPFSSSDKRLLIDLLSESYISGLSISGGDPLAQYDELVELLSEIRPLLCSGQDIWLWTGYTFDEVQLFFSRILDLVDVIIDGKYEKDNHRYDLPWRGSSNQGLWVRNERNDWIKEETP